MCSTLFAATLVFALAALRVWADFAVVTPVFIQCQPVNLTWGPTNGPYDVAIVYSANPCDDPIVELGDNFTSNSFTWSKVNITANTQVMISVLDVNDGEAWSGAITVQPSNDTSCLTSAPSSSSTKSPSHTPSPVPIITGAAGAGLISNGASMIHISGVAVAFTALGALVALL